MPNFDGTGPQGAGPGTGRGMGSCGAGVRNGWFGRGRGQGFGFGRRQGGFCPFWSNTPMSKDQEKAVLEEDLRAIKSRLKELTDKK